MLEKECKKRTGDTRIIHSQTAPNDSPRPSENFSQSITLPVRVSVHLVDIRRTFGVFLQFFGAFFRSWYTTGWAVVVVITSFVVDIRTFVGLHLCSRSAVAVATAAAGAVGVVYP